MDPYDGLALRQARGNPITLAGFRGQPIVVAFLDDDPDQVAPALWNAVRAELRGLGAVLLLLARRGLWCFRPDDQLELWAPIDELDADDVAAFRRAFGLDPRASAAALFVV